VIRNVKRKSTPYKRGYQIEIEAKRRLEQLGADIVIRSSRSLSPIDLVAIFLKEKKILLVQVKKAEAPRDYDKLQKQFSYLKQYTGQFLVEPMVFIKKSNRYDFLKL